jgi:hypothetical protein
MGCGCNKVRIRPNTESYQNLINDLKKGTCEISLKANSKANIKKVYCTLHESSLPSINSSLHRSVNNNRKHSSIMVWGFNKNIYTGLDPVAGWVKIPVTDIDNYSYVGE